MTEEEKIYKYLQKVRVDKLPLENEIFAIRDSRKKTNDYTIYVDGYISLDAINKNIDKLNLIQELQEENKKKDKIIDLMAEDLMACGGLEFIDIGISNGDFKEDKEKLKQYFEKKAIQEEQYFKK